MYFLLSLNRRHETSGAIFTPPLALMRPCAPLAGKPSSESSRGKYRYNQPCKLGECLHRYYERWTHLSWSYSASRHGQGWDGHASFNISVIISLPFRLTTTPTVILQTVKQGTTQMCLTTLSAFPRFMIREQAEYAVPSNHYVFLLKLF